MIRDFPAHVRFSGGQAVMSGVSTYQGGEDALATNDGDTSRWSVAPENAGVIHQATFPGLPEGVTRAWFVVVARTEGGDFVGGLRVLSPAVATFADFSTTDYAEFVAPVGLSSVDYARTGYEFNLNRPSGDVATVGTAGLHVTYWALRVEYPGSRRAAPLRVLQRGNDGLGITGGRRVLGTRTIQSSNRASGIR